MYTIAEPDAVYTLPEVLREISGLVHSGESSFTCVQDELGILYEYDTRTGRVTAETRFGDDGDYEGLARVGEVVLVLRSDGTLFEVAPKAGAAPEVRQYATGIMAKNCEGLCCDAAAERLLIAARGRTSKDEDTKLVYGFDLKSRRMDPEPALRLDLREIAAFARERGIELPAKKRGFRLRTSALGLHPATGELYMLCASDHLLLVFDRAGRIQRIEALDPARFNKPEGISFSPAGDLFISNEGQEGAATILRFSCRQGS